MTALCVSNEMLRKNISENYSGILARSQNDDLFEKEFEIFDRLKEIKSLTFGIVSLGLEWTDRILSVCEKARKNRLLIENFHKTILSN